MTKDEALKLALEALENIKNDPFKFDLKDDIDNAITAIKEALAQPEQKSVAMADYMALTEKYVALKAAQRTWVGLTDAELSDCMDMSIQKTCRAVESKLKEKNT